MFKSRWSEYIDLYKVIPFKRMHKEKKRHVAIAQSMGAEKNLREHRQAEVG